MLGHPEESDEVKAKRELGRAAEVWTATGLIERSRTDAYHAAWSRLSNAALAYAATQPRPRKRRRAKR